MRGFSIEDHLRGYLNDELGELYTAMPCIVTNVVNGLSDQRVDVQPSISTLYKDGTSEEHTQILGVPVIFPGSMTTLISYPINVGDTVLCVFSQRSTDNFKIGTGQPTPANDYRKMSDRDAIAIPGLFPFSKSINKSNIRLFPHTPSNELVIAHNVGSATEIMFQFKQNGDLIVNTDFNVVVNSKTATVNAQTSVSVTAPSGTFDIDSSTWTGNINLTGNIVQSGNYTATGTMTFNGIDFSTHKHTGVQTGSGTSGGPTN